MRTEDFIAALAADHRQPRLGLAAALGLAVVSGGMVALLLLAMVAGFRPGLGTALGSLRVGFKFALMLSLLAPALGMLRRLAEPGAPLGAWPRWLLLPCLLAVAALSLEASVIPAEAWRDRMLGHSAAFCLVMIPLLASMPMAALMLAVRQGAPMRPDLAGLVTGLASGGLAGGIYALRCGDDSPFFVVLWFSLAIGIVTSVGWLIGRRWLRW
ncbi:DUF1109 domain-containing protein [Pseudoroseomonas cervicalis]|uniref:DUF1109 domain-containing protein n=1 Tax=Teichococcus cervicalis TaxID=204525 RepID=UPI00277FDAE2|nr:DUF1109 domain-containing protein [Pseudoroseomonas cervicalis]MDQ1079094.1 hypothetical protein [Pseudoroseomonas cervicalis]